MNHQTVMLRLQNILLHRCPRKNTLKEEEFLSTISPEDLPLLLLQRK